MRPDDCTNAPNPIAHQIYRELPAGLYDDSHPTAHAAPSLVELNEGLLARLGIGADWFRSDDGVTALSGSGAFEQPPIAMAYAGHQFGHWVPLLGDGRAHMLGQMVSEHGDLIDVQLKGSGRTRFSRGGDGRATLGAVLREYMVSEAMAGLGIPTTRSIAVIGTGETVMREGPMPGAVLVRSAASHIRVGTFQYASAQLGQDGVRSLADFVIGHHFPDLATSPNEYLELLDAVAKRQASLIAQWMLAGFIHGVMNTDNMSIVGETIDYGPCAFMDEFHPQKVFSSIDRRGRYAWDQQPSIAYWNLAQFAGALLPLIHSDQAEAETLVLARLDEFGALFRAAFHRGMREKLGVPADVGDDKMISLTQATIAALAQSGIDFTVFFDRLTRCAEGDNDATLLELFDSEGNGQDWLNEWRELRSDDAEVSAAMRRANPAVIARNHRVEQAIDAAVHHDDFDPFRRLCRALANPYRIDPADVDLQTPPLPEERVTQTFCGT